MAQKMNTGIVVSFYGPKGYGFIRPEGSEVDLFVHQSEIQTDGYRTLREGQKVKFLVAEEGERTKAVMVIPVDKLKVKKTRKQRNGNGNRNGVEERECYTCGGIGHLSRNCSSAVTVTNGGSRAAGDGSGDGKCGTLGHLARECTWEVVSRKCYKCGVVGHMARECTLDNGGNNRGRESNGVRGDCECYTCGEVGHLARECISNSGGGGKRSGGGGGVGNCYRCNKPGHFARDCPSKYA